MIDELDGVSERAWKAAEHMLLTTDITKPLLYGTAGEMPTGILEQISDKCTYEKLTYEKLVSVISDVLFKPEEQCLSNKQRYEWRKQHASMKVN